MWGFRIPGGIRGRRLSGAAAWATMAASIVFAAALASAPPARAQSKAPSAVPGTSAPATAAAPAVTAVSRAVYEYEVASIKPNKSGEMMPGFSPTGGDQLKITNMPLEVLVIGAFGVMPNQITGMPDWLTSERYDVDAKMDPATADALKNLSTDDRKAAQEHMLQALLTDRCRLTFHRETKELPTYTLVVSKNGPKFHESKPGEPVGEGMKVPDGHGGIITMQMTGGKLSFWGAPITVLMPMLTTFLGRTIVDKTGLTGKYDFSWQFMPSDVTQLRPPDLSHGPGASPSAAGAAPPVPMPGLGGFGMDPSAISAMLEDQLGLKLESAKGPVEIIVIDHIERPSED